MNFFPNEQSCLSLKNKNFSFKLFYIFIFSRQEKQNITPADAWSFQMKKKSNILNKKFVV